MKSLAAVFSLVLFAVPAFATDQACMNTLMSAPACVNQVNAEAFCARVPSDEMIQDAVQCISSKKMMGVEQKTAIFLCLGGYVGSLNPAGDETLCNP